MTRSELGQQYFNWMYQLVCEKRYIRGRSYRKAFACLHGISYRYILPMDGNRAEDGVSLRYRFGYENGYENSMIACYIDDRPCSVLEMIVALALRCEEHIMSDIADGDKTGMWFWRMMASLGIDHLHDSEFNKHELEYAIERFMDMGYERNGRGGLFTIEESDRDMRSVEIWYQMNWYLNTIT